MTALIDRHEPTHTNGRTALIVGAGSGIGRSIAFRLARRGHRIAVLDLDGEAAETAARELRDHGFEAHAFVADVTDGSAVDEASERIISVFAQVDVLVYSAGIISADPVAHLPISDWRRVLEVNLTGAFLCIRRFIEPMAERRWGRIILIASDAAKAGEPYLAHYCASKFGLLGLTQSVALEYGKSGVTVNAVCPSLVDTPMASRYIDTLRAAGAETPDDWKPYYASRVPIGRMIRSDDVAEACAFLAADEASAITGEAMNVSGGRVMR